jgi:hypothetical protein
MALPVTPPFLEGLCLILLIMCSLLCRFYAVLPRDTQRGTKRDSFFKIESFWQSDGHIRKYILSKWYIVFCPRSEKFWIL